MFCKLLSNKILVTLSMIGGCALIISIIRPKRKQCITDKNCVFITGCDSGLGYTVAIKCYELGFFVIAGCLTAESDGAKKLINLYGNKRMAVIQIDIRNNNSIEAAQKNVEELVARHGLTFTALVNNAAIMAFGEVEWQTVSMIENQIQVNLLGTIKLTKYFLPICRKYSGRVIIVTSHCSIQALPGLAPYTATKAGLRYFTDALRLEMKKYHVDIVNFIPGSFIMQSNIFARQQEYELEMRRELTPEQQHFYNDYFNDYNNYLQQLSQYRRPGVIQDVAMTRLFERALLEVNPQPVYKNQNWRYAIYHFLSAVSPVSIRDWLIVRFMMMPTYKASAKISMKPPPKH